MLKRPVHKSFRTKLSYRQHARAILQSEVASLVLLLLLFLYSNWCFQSLKRRMHDERAAVQANAQSQVAGDVLFTWGLDDHQRLGRVGGNPAVPAQALQQLEVVAMAASRHTLLVTRAGAVWSMGANDSSGGGGHGSTALRDSGQLGRTEGGWAAGQVLGPLQGLSVKKVAAGRYHSVAVTADGKVWTWGLNDWGQLGRTAMAAVDVAAAAAAAGVTPNGAGGEYHRDARLPLHKRAVLAAADAAAAAGAPATVPAPGTAAAGSTAGTTAGTTASSAGVAPPKADAAIVKASQQGTASTTASMGAKARDPGSSCSSGWSCHDGLPGLVEALGNVTAVDVKAGRYSTVVLDAEGRLWVWGYDGCATAGVLPQQQEAWRPRLVQGQLQGHQVSLFDVGYTFWLAATKEGWLFSCDAQDDGYAGTLPEQRKPNNAGQLGRAGSPHAPGRVLGPLEHKTVVAVAAGREHALAATTDGQLYSFGGGRAVLGRAGDPGSPGLVTGALTGQFVRHIATGEYFALAATDSVLYGWGSNAYLATGTGQGKDTEPLQPTAVAGPLGMGKWTVHALAAGYQHALALAGQHGSPPAATALQDNAAVAPSSSAGSGTSTLQPNTVEVVLTEEQKQAQEEYKAQQKSDQILSKLPAEETVQPDAAPQQAQAQREAGAQQGPTAGTGLKSAAQEAPMQAATANPAGPPPPDVSTGGTRSSTSTADVHAVAAGQSAGSPPADAWSSLSRRNSPNTVPVHEVWAAWKPSPWHDALAALAPDVFKLLPKQYNSMHKNPCWGGTGPQLACLPYFNIIGVSKCGTTDLHHRLTQYKHAILPATNKGPHFWDECPYPPQQGSCQSVGPSGDFQAYINLFSRAADLIRTRPDAITGEASSNTFTSANGIYLRGFRGDKPWTQWAGAAGSNATMPALLREAQPYLRLILMLRNPASRYYSAFNYYRWWMKEQKPPTPDDFHSQAVKDVQQLRDCVAASTVAECVRRFQPQQLVKGVYAQFLPDWLRYWPRQQLLIIRYEDYIKSVPQHLAAVLAFLGVTQPDSATLEAMAGAEVQNKKPYAPMRDDTRQLLESFYAPFNQELAALLGDDRWTWADDEANTTKLQQ